MKLCLIVDFNKKLINCSRVNYKADFIWQTLALGFGLFLASSLVNHSCDPNTYQAYYGTSTIFRAKRPISKGEQVTCSYLEPTLLAARFSRKERQRIIQRYFKFKC
jgi:SET domain